jgi:predicted ester cyclase
LIPSAAATTISNNNATNALFWGSVHDCGIWTVHDIIGEGDKVASRVSWEGTHKGEMMGIPPSNKRLNVSEIHIYRFSNGKVVERWGEWDMFGMMQQIGIIPTTT